MEIATYSGKINSTTNWTPICYNNRKYIASRLNLEVTVAQLWRNQNLFPVPEARAMHLLDLRVIGM
jgi:hypothetical protein